jgi:hexosaminidase
MWTEHVNAATIDSRIWPRLAAVAERFWSPREVNNVADMYQRLRVVEERLDEFGLGHVSHTDRLLQQTVPSADTRRAIALMLEAVGPPTFGQRVRGMVSSTDTPLTGMIDAAVPDPWGRFEISRLVGELLADSVFGPSLGDGPMTPAEAREELRRHLTRWHDAALVVHADSASGMFVASGAAAAMALERVTFIGLEALQYLGGTTRAPQGWGDLQLAELTWLEQPQNLLRVMIVSAVRRLVNAAESGHE